MPHGCDPDQGQPGVESNRQENESFEVVATVRRVGRPQGGAAGSSSEPGEPGKPKFDNETVTRWLSVTISLAALAATLYTLVLNQRAWVLFDRVEFAPQSARVYVKNVGHGVAVKLATQVATSATLPKELPAVRIGDRGQSLVVAAPDQSFPGAPVGMSKVCETCVAYVFGRIAYEDQFGFDRETGFCIFASPEDRRNNAAAFCDVLNYAN